MRSGFIVAGTTLGLSLMVLLNATDIVRAQTGVSLQTGAPAARHAGGKRLQKLANTLALTDAQKVQIKPILRDAARQAKAVRQDTSLSPTDKKAKVKSIREGVKSQILPLLTPEQKAKLAGVRRHHGKKAPVV